MERPTDEDIRYLKGRMELAASVATASQDINQAVAAMFALHILRWILGEEPQKVSGMVAAMREREAAVKKAEAN